MSRVGLMGVPLGEAHFLLCMRTLLSAKYPKPKALNPKPVCLAEELAVAAEGAGLELEQLAGLSYDLAARRWALSDDPGINYIAYFQKPGIARN